MRVCDDYACAVIVPHACIAVQAGVVVWPAVIVWFDGETSTKVSTVHHATSGQW